MHQLMLKSQKKQEKLSRKNQYGFTQYDQIWLLNYEQEMSKLDRNIAKVDSHLNWKDHPQDDVNLLKMVRRIFFVWITLTCERTEKQIVEVTITGVRYRSIVTSLDIGY